MNLGPAKTSNCVTKSFTKKGRSFLRSSNSLLFSRDNWIYLPGESLRGVLNQKPGSLRSPGFRLKVELVTSVHLLNKRVSTCLFLRGDNPIHQLTEVSR